MKKQNYLLVSLFVFILSACTQRVHLTVNEPPAVSISKEYKNGGFINRTFAAEGSSQFLEKVDNARTFEGNLDVTGSKAAIQGAFDYATTTKRFDFLTILDSMTVKNGGVDIFPAQLSWQEVESICTKKQLDFLIVLEVYDTDTKINYSTGTKTQQTPLGSVNVPIHKAQMSTNINTGWRIYDPKNKLILDEFRIGDCLISRGSGINPLVAATTLLNREQAVQQISLEVGRAYAGRIEPQQFRVWRDYFNKGSQNLKMARRRSEVNNWEGAAELWQKDLNNPKLKVAGRAHYNMAIYKEITGDVYGAREMAQKAYSDYRIKEALIYSNILNDRIARIEKHQIAQE